jgi:hypothetical protein
VCARLYQEWYARRPNVEVEAQHTRKRQASNPLD